MKVKLYAVLDQASGVYDGPVPTGADRDWETRVSSYKTP